MVSNDLKIILQKIHTEGYRVARTETHGGRKDIMTCPPKTSPGKMLDLGLIRKGVYLWVEGRIVLSRSSIS